MRQVEVGEPQAFDAVVRVEGAFALDNDFVASFVGAGSARRTLRIREVGGRSVVVDGDDRPTGVLAG